MNLPTIPALEGSQAKFYHQIAEQFRTSPTGHVRIEDFGSKDERVPISPKIGYLARRGSEKVRISLGLSYRKNGKVYGAIMRHKIGEYQWIPDFVWPAAGEVDPAVLRAAEKSRVREANAVKAKPRIPKVSQPRLTDPEPDPVPSERPVEAPVGAVEAPPVPEATPAPVVAPEAPVAAVVECQVLADTGDLIVLRYNGNVIVAEVTTRSAVR